MEELREKIIGLGEQSRPKSFYPEFRERLSALERFRALLDQANDAIVVTDVVGGRVTDANQATCLMLGCAREELIGRPVSELSGAIAERIREHLPGKVVSTLCARSGRQVPVEGAVAFMGLGITQYAVAVVRDVSERQRAAEELRDSEARYRLLFQNMLHGLAHCRMLYDDDGRPSDFVYLDVNDAFGKLTGLANVIGKRITEVIPGIRESSPDLFEVYGRVASTGQPERFETYVRALHTWLSISAYSPRKDHFVAIFDNITERKRAEQGLEQSREGLSLLARASLRVMRETDLEGMLQSISEAALALTGARVATCGHGLVGGQMAVGGSARAPDAPPCPPGNMFGMERGGVHMELVERSEAVRLTDAQLRAHPRWWGLPEGHVPMRGLLGVRMEGRSGHSGMVLVTDKRQGEFDDEDESRLRQLAAVASLALQHVEARISLEESDRRKNQFLGMLSHELRNPLAPIRNSLFILDRAPPGSDQAQRAQAVIGRQVAHMTRLVDDLLDVTRISHGKIQLQREPLDLDDVQRRAVEDHRSAFIQNGLALLVETSDRHVRINGDRTRITQVIGNLLQNAAKFTPAGGTVTVSVEANTLLRQAVLRVRDTGMGIAPDMLPRIFEPFAQADTTLDRSKGGLGLGLALAKGLVEMHGGTVSVGSEGLGKGAEFTVRLPLETTESAAIAWARGAVTSGGPRRVLIIEDNVDAAESLREVLELGEHLVEVARSGAEGVEKARTFGPDVVLCDIGLPGMDGYEVARAIRADPALRGTTLVALTGYAAPDDVAKAREAGFDHHIAKPPNLERIEQVLEGRGMPRGPKPPLPLGI